MCIYLNIGVHIFYICMTINTNSIMINIEMMQKEHKPPVPINLISNVPSLKTKTWH